MSPLLAFVVLVGGVSLLFFLDREKSAKTASALWLPVIWLWINGSRPPSVWLGTAQAQAPGQVPASSVLDQLIAGTIMLLGIIVIVRRRKDVVPLLKSSWPVLFYFSFGLISMIWSDFPAWGFKRWVRAIGELVMVLIIVTDRQPTTAFRRFLSRVGFILLPASIFLIKYYPIMGRGYDQWGLQINVGVTTNKNSLGVVAFVVTLGTVWQVLRLLGDRKQPDYTRRLLAQGTLLFFGIDTLLIAHSATSGASFLLGTGLMLITALPLIRRRPSAVHALAVSVLLGGAIVVLLGGADEAVKSMGRSTDFTGRTPIWTTLIGMPPNALVGAGFETFWIGPRVVELDRLFPGINESHNGYIEVYLNLGLVGLGLIALILGQGYRRAVATFRRDPTFGSLLLAYVVTALSYNVTEAGFRMLGPAWFFLLFAVIAANKMTSAGKRRTSRQERLSPAFIVREPARPRVSQLQLGRQGRSSESVEYVPKLLKNSWLSQVESRDPPRLSGAQVLRMEEL